MQETGAGNAQVLMRRTVKQNDGLCRGHLVFLPIADSTQLIQKLPDSTFLGFVMGFFKS